VLACNDRFFNGLQGAIRTLDTHWSDHQIIFYDLGLDEKQKQLVKKKKDLFVDLILISFI
jgi:hypothetical protein